MSYHKSPLSLIAVLALSLIVAACAGGSGGGSDSREAAAPAEQAEPVSGGADAVEADDGLAMTEQEAAEEAPMEEAGDMAAEDEAVGALPPQPAPTMAAAPTPAATAPAAALATAPTGTAQPDAETLAPERSPDTPPTPVEVNPFTRTTEDPLSTFAMDVDTASYSAARNFITSGRLPPPHTVRVEEFVNYFDYGYPNVEQGAFGIFVDAAPAPSGMPESYIARVGIQGQRVDERERDDALLTFVVDISGSMDEPNRLPLVKESLLLLLDNLRPTDQVALVVYSDDTRTVLEHTPVAQRDTIARAINGLGIEGSTNVEAGLRQAYQLASRNFTEGAINRVILCSDGVANVGATGPDAILERVRDYASQGVLLTTVGFGMDYNDYLMEQLANDGNGNYAYVDTLDEAERVFVDNMTGTLQVIARDAKIQVEFNPEVVSQYRLLGYENRAVADTDFRNDEVDAGEVGAGHSVTALYEMRLTGQGSGEALVAQVRYEDPDSGEVRELASPLNTDAFAADYSTAPANLRLAVAAAAFAEQLRDSGYAQNRTLDDVLVLAEDVAPQFANDSQVQEFVALVRQAQAVSR